MQLLIWSIDIISTITAKNNQYLHNCKKRGFVAKICKYALYDSSDSESDGLFCGRQKPANPWHTGHWQDQLLALSSWPDGP